MKIKSVSLLMACLVMYGCATMNADECVTANWEAVGYEDGSAGYDANRFKRHRKSCAKHGVSADFSAYKRGHDNGLVRYCIPERGYRLGKVNKPLPDICPTHLIGDMKPAYKLGYTIYLEKQALQEEIDRLKESITSIDETIATLRKELDEHQEYLTLADKGLQTPNLKASERLIFYTQRTQMRQIIKTKQEEIDKLEVDKQPYQQSINGIRKNINQLHARPMPTLR